MTDTHKKSHELPVFILKQENEEERLQLAQKLLGLCTSVLRVRQFLCLQF